MTATQPPSPGSAAEPKEVVVVWSRKRTTREALSPQISMANALYDEGAHEQAETLIRRLLPDCDRAFGRNHPESIALRNLLGSVLYQQRKLHESAELHSDAMNRAIRVLGRDDPTTLSYAHNYGAALAVQGRIPEAVAVLTDTHQRRTRRLGAGHEDTLATANSLGATLFMAGPVSRALALLQQAYTASRVLPAGHPLRDDIARNLDIARRSSGRY